MPWSRHGAMGVVSEPTEFVGSDKVSPCQNKSSQLEIAYRDSFLHMSLLFDERIWKTRDFLHLGYPFLIME